MHMRHYILQEQPHAHIVSPNVHVTTDWLVLIIGGEHSICCYSPAPTTFMAAIVCISCLFLRSAYSRKADRNNGERASKRERHKDNGRERRSEGRGERASAHSVKIQSNKHTHTTTFTKQMHVMRYIFRTANWLGVSTFITKTYTCYNT